MGTQSGAARANGAKAHVNVARSREAYLKHTNIYVYPQSSQCSITRLHIVTCLASGSSLEVIRVTLHVRCKAVLLLLQVRQ